MKFEKTLYFKETGSPHVCRNSVDYSELLASGWYFESQEDAQAEDVEFVEVKEDKPKPKRGRQTKVVE